MNNIATLLESSIATLLFLFGCTEHSKTVDKIVVPRTEIVAVYMHHVGRFSVAIQTENKIDIVQLPWQLSRSLNIIADVPRGSPMWYYCDGTYSADFGDTTGRCEIHIRNVDDINTAGWNYGKSGSGTTKRIQ